ncbi:MAG: helix-turn-helix transcriptional regulator [Lachnospiraceae bacterium]|nr:helix-turn-helix transcriptional regulator [Lachnospiraceae bacterium]
MDFLEKLNDLMEKNHLNKSTLSKACNIPYTTIDGWYKKGYEGLKLTTLRKLAEFFGTSLDYWASEDKEITAEKSEILKKIQKMSDSEARAVLAFVNTLDSMNKEKRE